MCTIDSIILLNLSQLHNTEKECRLVETGGILHG